MIEFVTKIAEFLLSVFLGRRQLTLLVHRAILLDTNRECYFINATNLSRDREIEVTHIWFESDRPVHVLNQHRPLPRRLRPEESWETWIQVDHLNQYSHHEVYSLARARLSTGKIVKSKQNRNVPTIGAIPGGAITS